MLGMLLAVQHAVAHLQDEAFPGGQGGQHLVHPGQSHLADDGVFHLVRLGAQDIHVGDVIALAVGTHAVLEGHVAPVFPAGTEGHEDLILNAPRRIGAKGGSALGLEAVHGLDQADHADGDQVVRAVTGHGVLAGNVAHQAQAVGDEGVLLLGEDMPSNAG